MAFGAAAATLALGSSCVQGKLTLGAGEEPPAGFDSDNPDDVGPDGEDGLPVHYAEARLTRLSPQEYDRTVTELLGRTARPSAEILPLDRPPDDADYPFDNDGESQVVSASLIEAAETLATENAAALVADDARLARVMGCTPTGVDDDACMQSFVVQFGRRAFRRPLNAEEIERYLSLHRCSPTAADASRCGFGVEAGDVRAGVAAIVAAMLTSPYFLYRVEIGAPVEGIDGTYRLTGYEIAARLSFLLLGATPDDALLDQAAAGDLDTAEGVRLVADELLDDPRAWVQIARFHAQWLGYESIPVEGPLAIDMRLESDALVQDVIFGRPRSWLDIFLSDQTFLTAELATHYGLPVPEGGVGWVPYDGQDRRGILSHAAYLAKGRLGDDTSPVKRGKHITTMLLCTPIPPPPPTRVSNPAEIPGDPNACKPERYAIHRQGGCAGCHQYMEPIGFGLESFDATGVIRSVEPHNDRCAIESTGSFPSMDDGTAIEFHGARELATLLASSGRLEDCATLQLFRYAVGHNVREGVTGLLPANHAEDLPFAAKLAARFRRHGSFRELLLDLVSSTPYLHRVVPAAAESSATP